MTDYAFDALVARHRPALVRYAASRLGPADAEDVVQEALVRAHAALQKGARPANPVAWLHAIVRNGTVDAWRARPPGATALTDDLACAGDAPEAVVQRKLLLGDVVNAVGALPARQRDALVQVSLGGASYDEVADAQQTTVSAVKSMVNRARVSVRRAAAAIAGLPQGLLGGGKATGVAVIGATSLAVTPAVVPHHAHHHHKTPARVTHVRPAAAVPAPPRPDTALAAARRCLQQPRDEYARPAGSCWR